LKSNPKPYISAGISRDHSRIIILSYPVSLRGLAVFTEEVAIFLIDNCLTHAAHDVTHLLTEARVRLVTFAPQIPQVFQVLDLTLFDVIETLPRYELSFGDDNMIVKFIMKVYHDFRQTMVKPNI
jgi:hypothetical protein